MPSLSHIIRFIRRHPFNAHNQWAGVARFIRLQIENKIFTGLRPKPFTQKTKLWMGKGSEGGNANYYCGLVDLEQMSFLLHFLKPEDLFVDVGANIGAYTILASGEIGAKSISFEPAPATYQMLCNNISLNNIESKTSALNVIAGGEEGIIKFTVSLNSSYNHVATDAETNIATADISINTLDNILTAVPALIKIDVEGYETEVINGAEKTLHNKKLQAIIIELNGSGARYGYDDNLVHSKIMKAGFKPYTYNYKTRELIEIASKRGHDTIYIRDIAFANERVKSAGKIKVHTQYI